MDKAHLVVLLSSMFYSIPLRSIEATNKNLKLRPGGLAYIVINFIKGAHHSFFDVWKKGGWRVQLFYPPFSVAFVLDKKGGLGLELC